jgi:hypothetical protein
MYLRSKYLHTVGEEKNYFQGEGGTNKAFWPILFGYWFAKGSNSISPNKLGFLLSYEDHGGGGGGRV